MSEQRKQPEVMQWAQGYLITAYCDCCQRVGNFTGESKTQAIRHGRQCGWLLRPRSRTGRCRLCLKTGAKP
jgi:hypothetical protein